MVVQPSLWTQQEQLEDASIPQYELMSPEMQSIEMRRFIDKFLILRNGYEEWDVPIPTPDMPLRYVHQLYVSYVKQITIHGKTMYYKIFVVVLFGFIEWFSARNGIDLTGYAALQIKKLQRYDAVLLELGEKYYSPTSGEMSVEIRIFGLAAIHALIFFGGRYLEKNFGIPAQTVYDVIETQISPPTPPPPPVGGRQKSQQQQPSSTTTTTTSCDAQGLPMAPGTEDAIRAVASDATAGGGGARSAPPVAAAAPPAAAAPSFDFGGLLGGLLNAAAAVKPPNGGGGGGDIGNLVGAAMSFLTPQQQPSQQQARAPPKSPNPQIPRASPKTTATASSPVRMQSPPTSARREPVFVDGS
jgi:hypothetical protein